MNHLLRSKAPITDDGWKLLDEEARERLTASLAARKMVDFSGPHGWKYSASNLGRTTVIKKTPIAGVDARARQVLPLVEVQVPFAVSRDELADDERGAIDADLDDMDEAARKAAIVENIAVFHGWKEAGITGIAPASTHPHIGREDTVEGYPRRVAHAVQMLLRSGIEGSYGLAVSPEEYTAITEGTELGGYPLFDHLRKILGGPIVVAPGLDGGIVLSLRGGDFLFESGEDLAVGYSFHDAGAVYLYFEETFSFRVATPEAAVVLD